MPLKLCRIPAAMLVAPKSTKHPNTTVAPCRQSSLPVNIKAPTPATAITAITVATVPSIVPCNHRRAATSGFAPSGSESDIIVENFDWGVPPGPLMLR